MVTKHGKVRAAQARVKRQATAVSTCGQLVPAFRLACALGSLLYAQVPMLEYLSVGVD